jgi:hypothetical protein
VVVSTSYSPEKGAGTLRMQRRSRWTTFMRGIRRLGMIVLDCRQMFMSVWVLCSLLYGFYRERLKKPCILVVVSTHSRAPEY